MANPRADLEKLENAYTADPEPKCGCGAPMKLVDQYQYEEDWECLEVPDMHHRFNVSRSPGDPAVLEAVEEIRYLRQLVRDAATALKDAYKTLIYEEQCAETPAQERRLSAAITKAELALNRLGVPTRLPWASGADSAQKGEG